VLWIEAAAVVNTSFAGNPGPPNPCH